MWLKISEELYLPSDELVGFFGPGVLTGGEAADETDAGGAGRGGRADALMKDGRVVALPFRMKVLAGRFTRAAAEHKTAETGE